jgi:DNA-binding GntR family transcriptional regulator
MKTYTDEIPRETASDELGRTPDAVVIKTRRGPEPAEEEVLSLLTRGIITKQIRPGSRIREAALATNFGISRARVRRALQKLAELDVVEFRFNLGAFVSRPTPDEARAVFRTRRVLEAEAVRAASVVGTPESLDALDAFVVREAEAFGRNQPGLNALSSGFHAMIAELSANPVLAKMLNHLIQRCVLIQALYEREDQKTICLVDEHSTLVGLMRAGRIEDAVVAMGCHLDHIEQSLDYDRHSGIDERLLSSVL